MSDYDLKYKNKYLNFKKQNRIQLNFPHQLDILV